MDGNVMKDLEIGELHEDMLYDRMLWYHLIHIADLILWDKAWLSL